jgi:hypothetical protein
LFRVLAGTNLSGWTAITTNRFGGDGTALWNDGSPVAAGKYYRVVMP